MCFGSYLRHLHFFFLCFSPSNVSSRVALGPPPNRLKGLKKGKKGAGAGAGRGAGAGAGFGEGFGEGSALVRQRFQRPRSSSSWKRGFEN